MGSSCSITTLYTEDSGEFWFEAAGGKKSNSVNITVQRGSVILESPALLVMEGDAATLSCRNKMASSNLTAVFYKDGFPIWSNSMGTVTINSVSKSNEGRYKCHISGGGESPESWLVVRDSTHSDGDKQTAPSSSTPWIIITVALMLLLVVVGLHHFGKDYWNRVVPCLGSAERPTASAASAVAPLASSEANVSDAIYAVVRKNRKNDEGTSSSLPLYYTLDLGGTQLPAEAGISNITATSDLSSGTNQCVMEDPFDSAIQSVAD
ncbi:uncharacterized protein [Embiotoca jacksoni]|uniref:uncharacterized protein n=1 Tax=Embiotoca jacksoni TaxID=100190 RepID=UPI003703C19C